MKKIISLILATLLCVACFAGCGAAPAQESETPDSMALILSGPANDQGWNAVAVGGMEATAAKYNLKTTIMENVEIADMESAYRQLAAEGYDIIVGHGYQFGEPAAKISAEFPNKFFMATESAPSPRTWLPTSWLVSRALTSWASCAPA